VPLLMCPNDNSGMQKVTREGVDIDICPTCKGVWLDRGELEKLMTAERSEADAQLQARGRFQEEVKSFERDPDKWKREHRYDDREKRYRYDGDDDDDDRHRHGRRRRGFDLFDIFD
jgi:Zn-finger nucleic acid-binding protein